MAFHVNIQYDICTFLLPPVYMLQAEVEWGSLHMCFNWSLLQNNVPVCQHHSFHRYYGRPMVPLPDCRCGWILFLVLFGVPLPTNCWWPSSLIVVMCVYMFYWMCLNILCILYYKCCFNISYVLALKRLTPWKAYLCRKVAQKCFNKTDTLFLISALPGWTWIFFFSWD